MTRSLVVHPEAAAEVEVSAAWYEAQREGLGLEYLAAVDHAMASVAESPLLYPAWKTDLSWRRCVIRRFPYVVFFEVMASATGRSPGRSGEPNSPPLRPGQERRLARSSRRASHWTRRRTGQARSRPIW